MTERPPFRILMAEDNDDHAELMIDILSSQAPEVEIERCADGLCVLDHLREAKEGAERSIPDLILLDLDMPGLDGFGALSAIKQDPRLRRIPVVILTTSRARSDVVRALDNHANSYVCKSTDFESLEALLGEVRRYWAEASLRVGVVFDDAS